MQQVVTDVAAERPLWRRIVDFPLVAMVIAVVIYLLAAALAVVLGKLVPLSLGKTARGGPCRDHDRHCAGRL